MSTRATIILKVKKGDIGRVLEYKSLDGKVYTTTIEKEFLVKYNHWDGYPSHLGQVLLDNFNSYDKAMNLMSGGDSSSINEDGTVEYYIDRDNDETWENNNPHQDDKPFLPIGWTEWCYKFSRGHWYVAPVIWGKDGAEKIGRFTKLTQEYIDKHD